MSAGPLERGLPPVPEGFEPSGKPLAVGPNAVVWPARHERTGRRKTLALKVWRHPLEAEEQRSRFLAEASLHEEFSEHPNIVRLLWADVTPQGYAWIATELYQQSLADLLDRQSPLGLPDAVRISVDLLDGLAAMHARGVVHRDVKPGNVLVQDGHAALCDLGIAMKVDALTRDNQAGTPVYLAPELLRQGSAAAPDYRSDVYSAARTIRAATGLDVPPRLDNLLTRAESNDPADRPHDAADFAARLREVGQGLGVLARPAPATDDRRDDQERPGRARRRSVRWLSLGALAALAAGGGVYLWENTGEGNEPPAAAPAPAASATPDIDPQGQPVVLPERPGGPCAGALVTDGRHEHRVDDRLVAVTTIYHETSTGRSCALLTKDRNNEDLWNRSSHLALTLCNAQSQCDNDWHSYRREAGPVSVPSSDGCVSWRASMMDPTGSEWLLRDLAGTAGC